MSRIDKVKKNVAISYLSQIATALVAFACRTVFIRQLDAAYLGVNGLFTNILGILSLAELGFGTAMNFEMYKPVAEKDYPKVNALLRLYKKVYHGVALFILLGGLAIAPFITVLIKAPGNIGNIYIYYAIYIINSAIGYYASYLLCLTNAEQDEYISSIFTMGQTLLANVLEIIALFIFKSFYAYLFVWLISTVLQQVALLYFFKRKYSRVLTADPSELDNTTQGHIKKNMGGLIISKLSEVLRLQTDNIIIALGMNIVIVGYADNYYLIINYLKKIVLSLLKSVVPSLGNMVALESKEKSYEIFKIYDFVDYFIYSMITICLVVLFQPFISLWAGQDCLIDNISMFLMCASFYISGRSQSFLNYKTAHGIFYDIKITSIVTVVLNIVISVGGMFKFGLIGVYIGTCVSGLYENISILGLSYAKITGSSLWKYYGKRTFQATIIIVPVLVLKYISSFFVPNNGWLYFIVLAIITVFISLLWISVVYWRSSEYSFVRTIIGDGFQKLKRSKR